MDIALIAVVAALLFTLVTLISALVGYHFRATARIHRRHAAELREFADAFEQMRRDYDAMTERWQEMAAQMRQRTGGNS
ncbi:hypothetical protein FHX37_0473 [Haloactinospora alba]|uniref:Uncharacterized protein n=1 Tax=Haloactinospora alba TaxID=405555 RepID=A0A543NFJ2_9ACTN|nr:hypothetical protein [Haloactinospora alba]TQN30591.1 hypothetical protein FHX37_0473 [Haloactinospora alba]